MALLERLSKPGKKTTIKNKAVQAKGLAQLLDNDKEKSYQDIKTNIHRQIIENMPLEQQVALANQTLPPQEVQRTVLNYCNRVLEENPFAIPLGDRDKIILEVTAEILGLGPLEPLLKDDSVTEIMINGHNNIYIERQGKIVRTDVRFRDEEHLMHIVDRIVSPLGRRVDENSPLVDARLADGSRVNIIIPPLALNGACVTIRKFARDSLTMGDLIDFGSINKPMADFLRACVQGKLNIIVSGGTGSGKTTFLNILSSFIPSNERIVTLEDAAELQLKQDHVVSLETRQVNAEGGGEVTMRQLMRNALRMRPDRIIVGEVRTGEALDMLQAMNTGHDGSITTAHANTPRDLLSRVETMVLMAGLDLPVKAIREQISAGIDLIVHISRNRDGSRKVMNITEVMGMEGDIIILQDLFLFEQTGIAENGNVIGQFKGCGLIPSFMDRLIVNKVDIDRNIFFS